MRLRWTRSSRRVLRFCLEFSDSGTLCSLSLLFLSFPIEHKAHPLPPHLHPMAKQRPFPPPPPPTFLWLLTHLLYLLFFLPSSLLFLSHQSRLVYVSFSQPLSTHVWSNDRGSLACQICRLTSVILERDFPCSLSHSFFFSSVWFSRHSFIARRDSGFTTQTL